MVGVADLVAAEAEALEEAIENFPFVTHKNKVLASHLKVSYRDLGRGGKSRTHVYGFGDRYTNRCTTPL